jgi:hypothetical protein
MVGMSKKESIGKPINASKVAFSVPNVLENGDVAKAYSCEAYVGGGGHDIDEGK